LSRDLRGVRAPHRDTEGSSRRSPRPPTPRTGLFQGWVHAPGKPSPELPFGCKNLASPGLETVSPECPRYHAIAGQRTSRASRGILGAAALLMLCAALVPRAAALAKHKVVGSTPITRSQVDTCYVEARQKYPPPRYEVVVGGGTSVEGFLQNYPRFRPAGTKGAGGKTKARRE
jgi:hypothetical protein